jgi:hypothetical protein
VLALAVSLAAVACAVAVLGAVARHWYRHLHPKTPTRTAEHPTGVVTFDETLTEGDFKAFRERWESQINPSNVRRIDRPTG